MEQFGDFLHSMQKMGPHLKRDGVDNPALKGVCHTVMIGASANACKLAKYGGPGLIEWNLKPEAIVAVDQLKCMLRAISEDFKNLLPLDPLQSPILRPWRQGETRGRGLVLEFEGRLFGEAQRVMGRRLGGVGCVERGFAVEIIR
jgi:hypothetical protein